MDIRQNIIISLILHTALFTILVFLNDQGKAHPLHKEYLVVSIIEKFSDSLNYRSESNSEMIKEIQKQFTPNPANMFSSSPGNTDNKIFEIKRDGDEKKEQIDMMGVSLTESNREADMNNDVKRVSDTAQEVFFFQGIQAENQRSSSLNNQKRDFRNTDLLGVIRSSIERKKNYPLIARKRGIEGTVLVSFRINVKGLPQNVMIVKSSGYQILDEEVAKMLRKASPFPELNGEIVIPVTFKLKDSISDR